MKSLSHCLDNGTGTEGVLYGAPSKVLYSKMYFVTKIVTRYV